MTSPRTTSARVSRHAVSVRRLGRAGMIGALALALSGGLTGCGTVRDWFRSDKQKAAAPTALADFEQGQARIEQLACDVLVTPHPGASNLWDRIAHKGAQLVDPQACARYAHVARQALAERIARER